MVTSPLYDGSGGLSCLDFVNSMDRTRGEPWVDRLQSYSDLVAWSLDAGTLSAGRARELGAAAGRRPAEAGAALERARALRETLYRIFAAPLESARAEPADLARLNDELALALARARVAPGEGADGAFAWTWDASPGSMSALDAPLWPLARSAAELLTSPERALVKRCAGDTCLWLFLDRTKNHARRWCDMKVCGNRAKARRHRRARAEGRSTSPGTQTASKSSPRPGG